MEDSPKYTKKWPKSTRPTSWAAKGEAPEQDHQARGLRQHPKLCELSKGCQNLSWASLVNSQIPWSPSDVFWRVQENTKHPKNSNTRWGVQKAWGSAFQSHFYHSNLQWSLNCSPKSSLPITTQECSHPGNHSTTPRLVRAAVVHLLCPHPEGPGIRFYSFKLIRTLSYVKTF